MQAALRLTARVQSGGKVEIIDEQLPAGVAVDVIVLVSRPFEGARPSIEEVLAQAPGHLAFQSAEEVDAYLREERDAWER
jgi:hypothetical protein